MNLGIWKLDCYWVTDQSGVGGPGNAEDAQSWAEEKSSEKRIKRLGKRGPMGQGPRRPAGKGSSPGAGRGSALPLR